MVSNVQVWGLAMLTKRAVKSSGGGDLTSCTQGFQLISQVQNYFLAHCYSAVHCTAVLCMLCSVAAAIGLVASHYVVVVQCCYIVRSLVCRGVTSTSKNSLLSRFRKSFCYRLYRLYMLFYRLSFSVYQIIIMKNVYQIFQFEVTRALFCYFLNVYYMSSNIQEGHFRKCQPLLTSFI